MSERLVEYEEGWNSVTIDTEPDYKYGAMNGLRLSKKHRQRKIISWHYRMRQEHGYPLDFVMRAVDFGKRVFVERYKEEPLMVRMEFVYPKYKNSRGLYILFEVGETEDERIVRVANEEREKKERRLERQRTRYNSRKLLKEIQNDE